MKLSYSALHGRVRAYQESIRRRAELACKAAGIGGIDMCIIHNAMLDYEAGKPWAGIKYDKLRLARWLLTERRYAASSVLARLYSRKGPDAFDWGR